MQWLKPVTPLSTRSIVICLWMKYDSQILAKVRRQQGSQLRQHAFGALLLFLSEIDVNRNRKGVVGNVVLLENQIDYEKLDS
jgi:hypothetical protein